MREDSIKKLKEHCEKQIRLSNKFNDIKHSEEHETVLNLIQENQELKKQLEQIQQDGTALLGINETLSRQISMIKTQQKEFIKYLNNCIKELEKENLNKLQNTINLGIRDITREILSKYKEIVGDK